MSVHQILSSSSFVLTLSLSLSLSFSPSVASLKSQIHSATTVLPKDLYLVLPGGKTPADSDLALNCLQSWNVGTMYIFTTAVDPSFKMVHSTNSSVHKLSESLHIIFNTHNCTSEYYCLLLKLERVSTLCR